MIGGLYRQLCLNDDWKEEAMPTDAAVLALRSNTPEISRFAFSRIDDTYYDRAMACPENGGSFVVGGNNYGQGSSR